MQGDVEKAESSLLQAMMELRYKADQSVLESVLKEASKIETHQFTAETVERFHAAYGAADAVNSNPDAIQQEVDTAAEGLRDAINGLQTADPAEASAGVRGDQVLATRGGSAKTGDAGNIAIVFAAIALAGAGLTLSK